MLFLYIQMQHTKGHGDNDRKPVPAIAAALTLLVVQPHYDLRHPLHSH